MDSNIFYKNKVSGVMKSKNTIKNFSDSQVDAVFKECATALPLAVGTALLPICLSQEYHEGQKLRALFNLLQKSQHIVVLISGILYRNTIRLSTSMTLRDSFEEAKRRGKEWENKYQTIIDDTCNKTQITVYRWENVLLDEKYSSIRKQLEKHYLEKPEFKKAFDCEAETFVQRLLKKDCTIENREEALSLCLNYLIEECAVFVLMHKKIVGYTHFVYPGSISKAIQITFNHYNLNVSIVRPEFIPTKLRKVKYIDTTLNDEDIWQRTSALDQEAKDFADRRKVLSDCKIFYLKRASSYIRDRVAMEIDAHVMPEQNNLVIHKISDAKHDLLIYAPKDKYIETKFDLESSKKYIPSNKVDYRELSYLSKNSLPSCGVIDLRPLEKEQVAKTLNSSKHNLSDSGLICDNIKFMYSYLIYYASAPEATFYIINDGRDNYGMMKCKLYYSYKDDTTKQEQDDALSQINTYLCNLKYINNNANMMPFETTIKNTLEKRSGIQISDPQELAKLIFNVFKPMNEQGTNSQESTPYDSEYSSTFNSPPNNLNSPSFSASEKMPTIRLDRSLSFSLKSLGQPDSTPNVISPDDNIKQSILLYCAKNQKQDHNNHTELKPSPSSETPTVRQTALFSSLLI
jgi:tRNA-dependent cyclodipeptide synthase